MPSLQNPASAMLDMHLIYVVIVFTGSLNAPYDLIVRNLSSSQLLVSWHFPEGPELSYNKPRIKYTLQYRWEGEGEWHEKKVNTVPTVKLSSDIFLLCTIFIDQQKMCSVRLSEQHINMKLLSQQQPVLFSVHPPENVF